MSFPLRTVYEAKLFCGRFGQSYEQHGARVHVRSVRKVSTHCLC